MERKVEEPPTHLKGGRMSSPTGVTSRLRGGPVAHSRGYSDLENVAEIIQILFFSSLLMFPKVSSVL